MSLASPAWAGAAPVGVFSRGTTRISGSLSCGAREVRSPCAWLPRGVRPRLEGKPRTPLSSRVATGISWSPLSGLKGVKLPVDFGERTRYCSPGHAEKDPWPPKRRPKPIENQGQAVLSHLRPPLHVFSAQAPFPHPPSANSPISSLCSLLSTRNAFFPLSFPSPPKPPCHLRLCSWPVLP